MCGADEISGLAQQKEDGSLGAILIGHRPPIGSRQLTFVPIGFVVAALDASDLLVCPVGAGHWAANGSKNFVGTWLIRTLRIP